MVEEHAYLSLDTRLRRARGAGKGRTQRNNKVPLVVLFAGRPPLLPTVKKGTKRTVYGSSYGPKLIYLALCSGTYFKKSTSVKSVLQDQIPRGHTEVGYRLVFKLIWELDFINQ
ncbi:hypothetical protein GOODEAATRI_008759 [Goodea atripinnis]|uniref:Uncharacterized protein n=1 Tax=Goodea atripinnis TaxID=208336 RepID=A0ABV0MG74_9TELE